LETRTVASSSDIGGIETARSTDSCTTSAIFYDSFTAFRPTSGSGATGEAVPISEAHLTELMSLSSLKPSAI
jgi:hypothetical protein